ncbi:hypothetical protein SKAU_G00239140 [Synaphobranchus kaupii]|uniref:Uncharacterized protein n=1 Tax=Synaphobranchus kaupii TaxID=118154 RepID=A0A9Q1F795_SYNKA|nr:hypothetical protein SKAU_G00239140 [Synaphobranchus kaupii]
MVKERVQGYFRAVGQRKAKERRAAFDRANAALQRLSLLQSRGLESRASPGFPASWGKLLLRGGKVQAKALEGVVEKLMESLAPTEFGGEEKAAEGIAPVIPVAEEGEASLEAGGEAAARPELELLAAAVERAEALMTGGESEAVKRAAATTAMAEVTVTEKEEAGESLPGFSVQKRSFVEDWAGMMEEELPLDMGVVGQIFPSKKVKVGTPSLSDSEGSVGGGSGVSLEWESASPVLQSAYDVVSFSPGSPNEVPYLGDFEVEGPLSEPGV